MKIESSDIVLASQHDSVQKHSRRESLVAGRVSQADTWEPSVLEEGIAVSREQEQSRAFVDGSGLLQRFLDKEDVGALEGTERMERTAGLPAGSLEDLRRLSEEALEARRGAAPEPTTGTVTDQYEVSPDDKAKLDLIVAAIEGLTGKKIKLVDPAELVGEEVQATEAVQAQQAPQSPPPDQVAAEGAAWGVRYEYEETHYEAESSSFSAEGVVRTADGQEIAIDVELTMSREFMSHESMTVEMGAAAKDPLVINFDGNAAELTQRQYQFDIDSDGREDQIHFVRSGSGFLALDRNGDGAVNDGSELFGPTTGDGFSELAAHDADGNGWIDENDPVYSGLRIWSKDGGGNDQLVALGEKGVGAVYLGHATTPFELKGQGNELQGVVQSTGIYLGEDGGAGTVQHVDLVV